MLKKLIPILLVTAAAFFVAPAIAQTPDGETPANEGVCDELQQDSTPGLYGLCVAYCEALDCEFSGGQVQCAGPANVNILANYNKKMQPGDPVMPCFKNDCPCWDTPELPTVNFNDTCRNDLDLDDLVSTSCDALNGGCSQDGSFGQCQDGFANVLSGFGGSYACHFGTADCAEVRLHFLTRAEAEACDAQVESQGAAGTWSCFP